MVSLLQTFGKAEHLGHQRYYHIITFETTQEPIYSLYKAKKLLSLLDNGPKIPAHDSLRVTANDRTARIVLQFL
jgi:hypothetical protein